MEGIAGINAMASQLDAFFVNLFLYRWDHDLHPGIGDERMSEPQSSMLSLQLFRWSGNCTQTSNF